jgi:cephalosporin hydroxylase
MKQSELRFWGTGVAAFALLYGGINVGRWTERYSTENKQSILSKASLMLYSSDQWLTLNWMGIHTEQFPMDVWMTQEIIYEQKPDFIIETGTLNGGSACLWALLLREVNPAGRVITVDIKDQVDRNMIPKDLSGSIDFIIGSSVDPSVVSQIHKRAAGRRNLIIFDSDHHKGHVLKELQSYWDLVNPGGYLIVQDTNINGHPAAPMYGPGPWEAVQDFLKTNHSFRPDPYRERFGLTFYPGGYLKRE